MSIKSKIQAVYDLSSNMFSKLTHKQSFKVMSILDTIKNITDNNLSVARYGDGELLMMANQMNTSFQTYDKALGKKLKFVAKYNDNKFMVCIPSIFSNLEVFNDYAKSFYKYFLSRKNYLWYKYFDCNKVYGNAFLSRCYIDLSDKTLCPTYFNALKEIWQDRDIVFIEGEFSRLGVGNDLFDNAKSIKRILCPSINAYSHYDEILAEGAKQDKDSLILLALGATATCLAYDFYKMGFQAIDIGHVDIEYEWMNMGATEKVPVPSKFVNEAKDKGGWQQVELKDEKYISEIIAKIGTSF